MKQLKARRSSQATEASSVPARSASSVPTSASDKQFIKITPPKPGEAKFDIAQPPPSRAKSQTNKATINWRARMGMASKLLGAAIILGIVCLYLGAKFYGHVLQIQYPSIGQIALINGHKMHYVDQAPTNNTDKAPIVLIHGATTNLRDLKIALNDGLRQSRRVIFVDRPGHGYSSRPKNGALLEVQAKQIYDLVAHLRIKNPIILGHSYGGSVALSYAQTYGSEVSNLVLLAPASHPIGDVIDPYHFVAIHPIYGPFFRRTIMPLYVHLRGEKIINQAFEPMPTPKNYYNNAATPLIGRASSFFNDSQDLVNLSWQSSMMLKELPFITTPTTIIVGQEDTSTPPKVHAELLVKAMPNAKLHIVRGVGHPVHHGASQFILDQISVLD